MTMYIDKKAKPKWLTRAFRGEGTEVNHFGSVRAAKQTDFLYRQKKMINIKNCDQYCLTNNKYDKLPMHDYASLCMIMHSFA